MLMVVMVRVMVMVVVLWVFAVCICMVTVERCNKSRFVAGAAVAAVRSDATLCYSRTSQEGSWQRDSVV
jgi:hypothetical protein